MRIGVSLADPTGPDPLTALAGQIREAGVTDYVAADFSRGDDAPRTRALLKSLIR
jgi:hypothetical protein